MSVISHISHLPDFYSRNSTLLPILKIGSLTTITSAIRIFNFYPSERIEHSLLFFLDSDKNMPGK